MPDYENPQKGGMKNPMTPNGRRLVALGMCGSVVVVAVSSGPWWGFLPLFAAYALVIGFWPSNKALIEAEKMKELGDGEA